jgi:hypothetical protein
MNTLLGITSSQMRLVSVMNWCPLEVTKIGTRAICFGKCRLTRHGLPAVAE